MLDWPLFALLVSVFNAIIIQINHHYKVDGLMLSFYRSTISAICFAPFLFFVESPTTPIFYILAAFVGFLVMFADTIIFECAAKYGGRLTSLFVAVKILGGFMLWSIIDPSSFTSIWQNKLVFMGVVGCMLISILAIFMMRRTDASWKAFLYVAPAGIVLTMADSATKYAIQNEALFAGAITFAFVMCVSTSFSGFSALTIKGKKPLSGLQDKNLLKISFLIGVTLSLLVLFMNMAQATTPNPAYVNAVSLLSMLWIIIYHKMFKIPDDASIISGILFLLSALGLVLLVG